ncbi:ABC transporter ATP-binding protein [Egibacter rhizosphaerae]|uniref:ABC transporter ATP-binding protein n=1 Tax=Egibacter rhizosphaerae TaxID=1670831 RepID=A0A411YFG3_9ACTN|nr:ABC transporter ATP-binding protein [Egibacter rhizosphaerae]QBI19847.1 ABC transporter ATP-binding protein [Egibacter rhizosphaerae]
MEVQARGVAKVFPNRRRGDVEAIAHVDMDVAPGEFVSILGPSGCGKSTFLYIVGGFVEATGGSVSVGGTPITGPGPERGIVFQEFALFPWKTVHGNITYGLAEQGLSRREQQERAEHYIHMVGLQGMERLYPKELSGGMKQRVAIARTLATDPDVLLMDEPLGALDAQTRAEMQTELSSIWERTGKTVLFVTHAVEEALFFSDRVVVFSQRPARIKSVVDVEIPRPRDRKGILRDPRFAELHHHLWDLLHETRPSTQTGAATAEAPVDGG